MVDKMRKKFGFMPSGFKKILNIAAFLGFFSLSGDKQ